MAAYLTKAKLPASERERLLLAQGAPGALLSTNMKSSAVEEAQRFIVAATSGNRAEVLKVAFVQGHSGARAGYSDTLDALTIALYERMKTGTQQQDAPMASSSSRAIELVEEAKRLADANVSPQLISTKLLTDLVGDLEIASPDFRHPPSDLNDPLRRNRPRPNGGYLR